MLFSKDAKDTTPNETNRKPYTNDFGPPKYTISSDSEASVPSSSSQGLPAHFDSIQPVNSFHESRPHNTIKGHWRIDTDLQSPHAPFRGELNRRNLSLETQSTSINADAVVTGTQRASIAVRSETGSVLLKVRRPCAQGRPPVDINASTKRSCLAVHLPSSYSGPISWRSRRGTVNFSPAVKDRLTQFGQRADVGLEYGFIGDWENSGYREGKWNGDEASLDTESGSLWVYFVDEQLRAVNDHQKGVGETMVEWFGWS